MNWTCENCLVPNEDYDEECSTCGMERPEDE